MSKAVVILFVLIGSVASVWSQQTTVFTEEYKLYREGLDLYDKEKYTAAREKFDALVREINNHNDEVVMNAKFYSAMCAMELYNTDAEFVMREFVKAYPESPRLQRIYVSLGELYYRKKYWKDAIEWYEKVDLYLLSEEELSEYRFKKGYAHFREDDFDAAGAEFREIKDKESPYQYPALYYYSHIQYDKKNYQAALEGFLQLTNKKGFDRIVPYYITQIYYLQKKYQSVIDYGAPLLDTAKPQRLADVANLVGDSYYRIKKYDEAVTYLELYERKSGASTPDEFYRLAYAYYMQKAYKKAAKKFEKVTRKDSELGQNALYYLAQCYLKMDEKIYARNAYQQAADMHYDEDITEDALFRYAELAYELSNNPYDEAIFAFQTYLATYPESPRADDAYQYLINVYMTTRNYKAALESLEKVDKNDIRLQRAYQMVVYNYGVELFVNDNYDKAISNFKNVKKYPVDVDLNARSLFWIGECFYIKEQYPEARHWYSTFLKESGAFSTELYGVAHYNIAYCWLNDGEPENAIAEFRQYLDRESKDMVRLNDAYLRIADNYFRVKDDKNAIEFYEKAIKLNVNQQDYALFQKAMSQGYQGEFDEKIKTLNGILKYYGSGDFVASAKYELAEANRLKRDYSKAIKYYAEVVEQFPTFPIRRKAIMSLAQMYYQKKEYDKAIDTYMIILQDEPNADECTEAIFGLKDVYTVKDEQEKWEKIARRYACVDIDKLDLDSNQFYSSVHRYWIDGNCEKILTEVDKYLKRFPNGLNKNNALFYKGECLFYDDHEDESLVYYDRILELPVNEHTEIALIRTASMYYQRKEYDKALKRYQGLETNASNTENKMIAYIGQMRGNYFLDNYEEAKKYALIVMKGESVKESIKDQAHMMYAMSLYHMEDYEAAISEFNSINSTSKSATRAESKFYIAKIYFLKNDHKEVENQVLELIKQKPAYDYWVARAYMLLSDNFVAQGNNFQAKHTLQSIIDNYTADDDIVPTAKEKLAKIIADENADGGNAEDSSLELDMGGGEQIRGEDPRKND